MMAMSLLKAVKDIQEMKAPAGWSLVQRPASPSPYPDVKGDRALVINGGRIRQLYKIGRAVFCDDIESVEFT